MYDNLLQQKIEGLCNCMILKYKEKTCREWTESKLRTGIKFRGNVFLLVSHLLIFLQRKFIYSKPPGRRLVLADVHVLQSRSLAHVITSLAVGGFIASSLGPLSFKMSFLLIEWFKIPLVTYFGISNMSVVLQILTIMDNE